METKKQDWTKAQHHFEKTLQFNQHHGAALNNLGALLAGSGRIEAGLAKLDLALKLFPGFWIHNIIFLLFWHPGVRLNTINCLLPDVSCDRYC
ncbi:MAG TPA: hypothetical protein PLZ08_07715 [Bacillota bacterium]|nr:hypothetical protein [Bacillota bacterium]HOL10505.1 hypothetical protein [Bacillota bacterium]HOL10943.1 hypothetical protein [Bacillota bacterium]HPO97833.1 hypothetical protein [Bacillota bacterium]